MDTQTQIDRLIELAIIQRTELKQLVEQLPQLREHLNAEVEKVFEETEPQLRSELEEWTAKQTADKTAALGVALEAKIANFAKSLEISTQARYNAIIAEREENARLAAQAEAKIAEHAASLPSAVKEIVSAELARFPRAGEIDQLRKEFAEPRGLNPRGKWQASETYNRLDLVTYNGDSFVSNIDGNTEKPSRNAANWTLNAARGAYGGGGGITSLNDVLNAPTSGQIIGSQNGQYVPKTLVAGANITINETASSITIIGDEGQISLNDGTAASPALFFTNDTDTGIYRPAANTLGISVSGTQVAYFDANGITTVGAGATFDGSVHAANGNANNPSLSFTSDDNTGFFRHQPDEIGITLGGTQKATLTSTTFSITPNLSTSGNLTVSGTGTSSFAGPVTGTSSTNGYQWTLTGSGVGGPTLALDATNATVANRYSGLALFSGGTFQWGLQLRAGDGKFHIYDGVRTVSALTVDVGPLSGVAGTTTVGGNLTVSGSTNLTSSSLNSYIYDGTGWVWTSTGTSGGTVKGGIYAAGGQFFITANSSLATNRFSLNSSGDATVAGNLTVSGTGTSSFASGSKLGVGTTSPGVTFVAVGAPATLNYTIGSTSLADIRSTSAAATNAGPSLTFSGYYQTSVNTSTYGAIKGILQGAGDGNSAAGALTFLTANGAGSLSEWARLTNSGNLLLGTTTDSGNGKFQLATHTTSAGGIGFGTDTSLYRDGTGYVSLYGPNADTTFRLWGGATQLFRITNSSTISYVQNLTGSLQLASNGITALTLDASQNATFAGAVTAGGNVNLAIGKLLTLNGNATSGSYALQAATTGAPYDFRIIGASDSGQQRYFSFGYYTGDNIANAWNEKAKINSYTGDATFAGTIKPQQAATASAPTYVKGVIYFDTTLNKLRVGGATGWETITSV